MFNSIHGDNKQSSNMNNYFDVWSRSKLQEINQSVNPATFHETGVNNQGPPTNSILDCPYQVLPNAIRSLISHLQLQTPNVLICALHSFTSQIPSKRVPYDAC